MPITIAGRNISKATSCANALKHADTALVDLEVQDLRFQGMCYAAMVVFFKDDTDSLRQSVERCI